MHGTTSTMHLKITEAADTSINWQMTTSAFQSNAQHQCYKWTQLRPFQCTELVSIQQTSSRCRQLQKNVYKKMFACATSSSKLVCSSSPKCTHQELDLLIFASHTVTCINPVGGCFTQQWCQHLLVHCPLQGWHHFQLQKACHLQQLSQSCSCVGEFQRCRCQWSQ